MAKVKGSRQYNMQVVRHRPLLQFCLRGGALLLLVVSVAVAWFAGHQQGLTDGADALRERAALRIEVAALQAGNTSLDLQLRNAEQALDLDRQTLDSLQQTLLSLREMNSQLQQDVLFYKHILAPENDETGLVIGQLDLRSADVPGEVRYRLALKQQGGSEETLSGHVNVSILGSQDGQEVSLPLRSLSSQVEELDIPLQFRYFQNIEGTLRLPAGFEPQKVQILAIAESPTAKTVQQSFGWFVQP